MKNIFLNGLNDIAPKELNPHYTATQLPGSRLFSKTVCEPSYQKDRLKMAIFLPISKQIQHLKVNPEIEDLYK